MSVFSQMSETAANLKVQEQQGEPSAVSEKIISVLENQEEKSAAKVQQSETKEETLLEGVVSNMQHGYEQSKILFEKAGESFQQGDVLGGLGQGAMGVFNGLGNTITLGTAYSVGTSMADSVAVKKEQESVVTDVANTLDIKVTKENVDPNRYDPTVIESNPQSQAGRDLLILSQAKTDEAAKYTLMADHYANGKISVYDLLERDCGHFFGNISPKDMPDDPCAQTMDLTDPAQLETFRTLAVNTFAKEAYENGLVSRLYTIDDINKHLPESIKDVFPEQDLDIIDDMLEVNDLLKAGNVNELTGEFSEMSQRLKEDAQKCLADAKQYEETGKAVLDGHTELFESAQLTAYKESKRIELYRHGLADFKEADAEHTSGQVKRDAMDELCNGTCTVNDLCTSLGINIPSDTGTEIGRYLNENKSVVIPIDDLSNPALNVEDIVTLKEFITDCGFESNSQESIDKAFEKLDTLATTDGVRNLRKEGVQEMMRSDIKRQEAEKLMAAGTSDSQFDSHISTAEIIAKYQQNLSDKLNKSDTAGLQRTEPTPGISLRSLFGKAAVNEEKTDRQPVDEKTAQLRQAQADAIAPQADEPESQTERIV